MLTATLATTGAASTAQTVTVASMPAELPYGSSFAATGRIVEGAAPLAGAALTLETSPYPYRSWQAAAHGTSAGDGSFSIPAPAPQSNERVRVTAPGAMSPIATVTVDPRAALNATSLGPGRVRLSARIAHGRGLSSPPVTARWYLAVRGSDTFHLAATTQTRELPGAVTYASAIVDPPAHRFLWRVCLNPRWEAAMGPAAAHGGCPAGGFHLPHARHATLASDEDRDGPGRHRASSKPRARAAFEFASEGRGTPLPAFPTAAGIAAARRYLEGRVGRTAFAVVNSAGGLSGLNTRERFQSASVVKVMFLTAYLQRLEKLHRSLGASDRALLYPMIHESNNEDASAVLGVVGGAAVARVAREAGMRDYAPGVGWWAFTQTSAADQARFFTQLGRLIPARFYGYARYLMSTIEPEQSWGIPPVARPRWQVYFKTGALPSEGLYHEVALLERGPQHFTVAVLTVGDPSKAYGEETIAGVGARLLAGAS